MKQTKSIGKYAKVTIDNSTLERLQRELKRKAVIQIGVLGSDVTRKHKKPGETTASITNAEIGLIHEKGSVTRNIPRRSFLEMPLTTKFNQAKKEEIRELVRATAAQLDVKRTLGLVGVLAEDVVQDAFDTGGFGKWAPNSPRTVRAKGSSKPLIDIGELRKSVTSRVVEK